MNDLIIENLNKSYGRKVRALQNIQISLSPGIWGLLGPNGAGKTTLIRVLATILHADSGTITMGDISWANPSDVRKIIGYVPQTFGLYPLITVEEVLQHISILKGITKAEVKNQVEWALEQVNLKADARKKVRELSGGMLKRLAIAQSVIGDPKLLILDEPTAGLDPEERIRFRNIINNISVNKIIILSTHIVSDVQSVCSNAIILNRGKILACDSVSQLINQVHGYIVEADLSLEEYEEIKRDKFIITASAQGDRFTVRYLDRNNVNGANTTVTQLEDAYMFLLNQHS